jgi:type IV secretory pathway TrbD component
VRPTFISAFCKSRLFCGVEKRALLCSFLLSFLIGVSADTLASISAGISLFVVLCGLSVRLTKHDPKMLPILMRVRRQKAIYDPGKREMFSLKVT